ncbi:MAG: hypothetical protein M3297_07440 [Thermoproteota archaeon]|nr:hypothetical protein [Thermoproteota archaeon]
MQRGEDEPIDIIPTEKIAFIAYNIGVFESVQKFGSLIVNGKISGNVGSNVSRIADLLSEASAFYDAEMISQLINAMLHNYHNNKRDHNSKPTIEGVIASEVNYVMRQLKTTGISLP